MKRGRFFGPHDFGSELNVIQARDWNKLPARFAYLRPAAEDYDRWLQHHRYQDEIAMRSLTANHIGLLTSAYQRIAELGDAEPLSLWLDQLPREERRDERGVYWPVFRLFFVFEDLQKRGIEPFRSGRVRYWVPDPPLDWTKLPEELRYLAAPAERFGGYQCDVQVEEFVQNPPAAEMESLAAASEQIRLNDHAQDIFHWLDEYEMDKHPEAARVAWMLNLMTEAGVPIEE